MTASENQEMFSQVNWDQEYDVVVAGSGGSGLSAAITAFDQGSSVLILEKSPFPGGGQTRTSGLGAAFATDPKGAAEYLFAACSHGLEDADPASSISVTPKEDCLIFMQELAKNPEWLTSMGVEHTIRKGTSAFYPDLPGADSFCHVVIRGWGIQFLNTLKLQIEKRGIETLYETPVTGLIQNTANREIRGVYASSHGRQIAIKAKKGVVLCTGGFEFNEEMKANYLRPFPLKFAGWPYNTGDGIKLAQSVGADLWHMNTMVGYLNIWVPDYKVAWLLIFGRGIWVNRYGKRYTNDGTRLNHNWWLKHTDYSIEEPGYEAIPTYLIFDETIRQQGPISANSAAGAGYILGIQAFTTELGGCPEGWSRDNMREIEKGWIKKGDTLEDLGKAIGGKMAPADLKESVEKYNRYCREGHDPDFGRSAQSLKPLLTPPYYACPLYPGGINTCGGPRRNAYGQVLDPFKNVIPRLFSAGEMGSICGNVYAIGGLNAGEMLASGRLAGRTAADLPSWD
jgi:succinate dehydrogenase/fumarate reductase flavoprotein subunit